MAFTSGELTTIIMAGATAVVTILGAMGTLIVLVLKSKADLDTKTQRIEEKVDVVHVNTNSRLKEIEEKLTRTENALASALGVVRQQERARVELAHEAAVELQQPPKEP